jgi:hypothetical protein
MIERRQKFVALVLAKSLSVEQAARLSPRKLDTAEDVDEAIKRFRAVERSTCPHTCATIVN